MNAPTEPSKAERTMLLTYIRAARVALAELAPNHTRGVRLPSALNEIGMIVETTETAANKIMDTVEQILNLPQDLDAVMYRGAVEEKCMALMEACAFQDLTGQRSTKIVETLMHIEDKLGLLATLVGEEEEPSEVAQDTRTGDEVLLNGPAMPGEGVDQDDIDAMFA